MIPTVQVMVIGAGHAGCEAALALARMGIPAALVTHDLSRVAYASCNPAVGGLGKGHLVREVDALGGVMARVTDRSGIQFRRLNLSKGPAVRSTRVQIDMDQYSRHMLDELEDWPMIRLIQDEVVALEVRERRISAAQLRRLGRVPCQAVVVTAGTFLKGLIHVGEKTVQAGRHGEPPSGPLADWFRLAGLEVGRLKTGTPARLHRDSIDFVSLRIQHGDDPAPLFCWASSGTTMPQTVCHETQTTPETHSIIRENLHRAPLFSGQISGIGARYCPSIEDKVVRFADRDHHVVFLEPTRLGGELFYPNGISTSLPEDVQVRLIHSIPGLEHATVVIPGYAIEYDFYPPTQLLPSLQNKRFQGLFMAGQVNGTSGYEEAAAQGLLAGVNAGLWISGEEPVVLGRDEAYLGVMVDDLTTRGTLEPYRMFTSRAEHRLILREANADKRLTPLGRRLGLVGDAQWSHFQQRLRQEQEVRQCLSELSVSNDEFTALRLAELGTAPVRRRTTLLELLARPEIRLETLRPLAPSLPQDLGPSLVEELETSVKFQGYIQRGENLAQRLSKADRKPIPTDLDYGEIGGLTVEVVESLRRVQPTTIGQASRIPGMTPAALTAVLLHLAHAGQRGDP